jgi:hypothetical protein
MAESKTLTEELEERLDIFFGEDDAGEENAAPAPARSPLEMLKSVLLSLEWEITDRDLDKLLLEVETLKGQAKENSIELLFLKLLDSIARYIKVHKANVHPNTITLLNNAFKSYASVVETPDVSESEKKALLLDTINEFKEVKAAIAQGKRSKAAGVPEPSSTGKQPPKDQAPATPILENEPALGGVSLGGLESMTPHEAFALALQEIRNTIEKEFRALRAELRMWRNGQ